MTHFVLIIVALSVCLVNSQSCTLPLVLKCPNVACLEADQIIGNQSFYECNQTLKLKADIIRLGGNYSGLELNGRLVYLSNLEVRNLYLIANYTQTIFITGRITASSGIAIGINQQIPTESFNTTIILNQTTIRAPTILLQGFNITSQGSKLFSTQQRCTLVPADFSKVTQTFYNKLWLEWQDMIYLATISLNSNISDFRNSTLKGSIVASFANETRLQQSQINVTGSGCSKGGLGRAVCATAKDNLCCLSALGFSNSERKYYSYCGNAIDYYKFLGHSYSYMTKGNQLYSGSSGVQQSSGGGIAFILASSKLVMNSSSIEANGGDYSLQSTSTTSINYSGSGGAISILCDKLINQGSRRIFVEANGGKSSIITGTFGTDQNVGSSGYIRLQFNRQTSRTHQMRLYNTINADGPYCPVGMQFLVEEEFEAIQSENNKTNTSHKSLSATKSLTNSNRDSFDRLDSNPYTVIPSCSKCRSHFFKSLSLPNCHPCLQSYKYVFKEGNRFAGLSDKEQQWLQFLNPLCIFVISIFYCDNSYLRLDYQLPPTSMQQCYKSPTDYYMFVFAINEVPKLLFLLNFVLVAMVITITCYCTNKKYSHNNQHVPQFTTNIQPSKDMYLQQQQLNKSAERNKLIRKSSDTSGLSSPLLFRQELFEDIPFGHQSDNSTPFTPGTPFAFEYNLQRDSEPFSLDGARCRMFGSMAVEVNDHDDSEWSTPHVSPESPNSNQFIKDNHVPKDQPYGTTSMNYRDEFQRKMSQFKVNLENGANIKPKKKKLNKKHSTNEQLQKQFRITLSSQIELLNINIAKEYFSEAYRPFLRIVLVGSNQPYSPLTIPPEYQSELLPVICQQTYEDFIALCNKELQWTKFQQFIASVSYYFYPFHVLLIRFFRQNKIKKLRKRFNMWSQLNLFYDDLWRLDLVISQDFTRGHIDIRAPTKTQRNIKGTNQFAGIDERGSEEANQFFQNLEECICRYENDSAISFVTLFAGAGDFLAPFQVSQKDSQIELMRSYLADKVALLNFQQRIQSQPQRRFELISPSLKSILDDYERELVTSKFFEFLREVDLQVRCIDLEAPCLVIANRICALCLTIHQHEEQLFKKANLRINLLLVKSSLKTFQSEANVLSMSELAQSIDDQARRIAFCGHISNLLDTCMASGSEIRLGLLAFDQNHNLTFNYNNFNSPASLISSVADFDNRSQLFQSHIFEETTISPTSKVWLFCKRFIRFIRFFIISRTYSKGSLGSIIIRLSIFYFSMLLLTLCFYSGLKIEWPFPYIEMVFGCLGLVLPFCWNIDEAETIGQIFYLFGHAAFINKLIWWSFALVCLPNIVVSLNHGLQLACIVIMLIVARRAMISCIQQIGFELKSPQNADNSKHTKSI